ncbi:AraC family transcriptional regulator N-terminal domain-containing protein [Pseudomonas tolaasii]
MTATLLDTVRRYIEAHADTTGIARTPVPGLTTIRSTTPSGLVHSMPNPLICLVLQGAKQVTLGTQTFTFQAGDSLLITADVPTVSQVMHASPEVPYLSIVLDLDPAVIAELSLQIKPQTASGGMPVKAAERTDSHVVDVALRLMRILDFPDSGPVLHTQLVRELHYWLLVGRHGAAIRQLGCVEGQARRIARAVAVLRADFKRPLPVNQLAATAGMSPSSFHRHFRAITSLSPLQFQKNLRLIEARRMMMAEGASASSAAFNVGYESVSQFNREYARMFGLPPIKDVDAAKGWTKASA